MAGTQTQRDQYKDPFFRGAHRTGTARGRPICDFSAAVPVVFLAGGSSYPSGRVTLKVHPLLVDTFVGVASVFLAHGYAFEETAGGTLACRNIAGSAAWRIEEQIRCQCPKATTLHLHGLALDINPSRNRYRRVAGVIQWGRQTDIPRALVTDVYRIKTKAGRRAVEWGGFWTNSKDPMHFENDLTRTQLAVGIDRSTIKGLADYLVFAGGGNPPTEEEQVLKKGDKGNAVGRIQTALMAWNSKALPKFGADKDFGGETEGWVRNYQGAAELTATGIVDGLTGAFLLEYLVDHAAGGGTVDAYTKAESNARYPLKSHPHTATTTIK